VKYSFLCWTMTAFMALAPVASQAAQNSSAPTKTSHTKTVAAPKPEQQKLRGVPLWLLLGGLGTAAIILAASNSGKDGDKPPAQPTP